MTSLGHLLSLVIDRKSAVRGRRFLQMRIECELQQAGRQAGSFVAEIHIHTFNSQSLYGRNALQAAPEAGSFRYINCLRFICLLERALRI